MEDRNALDAEAAAEHGLAQSLPPSSILNGLPMTGEFLATHPVGSSSFGSTSTMSTWGWMQLMDREGLVALRLCTYPQYGDIKPTGIYVVEMLARLERRPVPAARQRWRS